MADHKTAVDAVGTIALNNSLPGDFRACISPILKSCARFRFETQCADGSQHPQVRSTGLSQAREIMNRRPHQVVAGVFLMYQSTMFRHPQVCHEAKSHKAASFRTEPTIVAVCSTNSMESTTARADNLSELSTNARHTDVLWCRVDFR